MINITPEIQTILLTIAACLGAIIVIKLYFTLREAFSEELRPTTRTDQEIKTIQETPTPQIYTDEEIYLLSQQLISLDKTQQLKFKTAFMTIVIAVLVGSAIGCSNVIDILTEQLESIKKQKDIDTETLNAVECYVRLVKNKFQVPKKI